jgi:8-oxo-dGTP pyrophosphatase MutT (NUDIX family)
MKTRVRGKLTKAIMKILRLKPVVVGIPVIIMNNKKEILLGKRNQNSYFYPGLWGLPGGMLEYNEKLEQGATSEVKWFKPSEIKKMKLAYTHKEILKKEGLLK